MTRRYWLAGRVIAMVADKKPPASTLYPAQRRDRTLSLTIECFTRYWLDLARSLRESKVQFVVEGTWTFRKKASGQNGRLNPLLLLMDRITDGGVHSSTATPNVRIRCFYSTLLSAILAPAPIYRMQRAMQENTSPTPSRGRKTSIGTRSPLPTPSFLSLCRRVVKLAQTCIPSLRKVSSDG